MDFSLKYNRLEKLGEGAYGKVYKGQNKATGQFAALKVVLIDARVGLAANSVKEIAALKLLNHPNIVKLLDEELAENKLTFVLEYCESDLHKFIHSFKPHTVEPRTVQSLMHQLLTGMAYCHSKNIIHRDIKPANILITKDRVLKIADFGLARQTDLPVDKFANEVATLWYRAPEVLLGSCIYGFPIDNWAIGCVFAEMMLGRPLFAGTSDYVQLIIIMGFLGTPSYSDMQNMFRNHRGITDEKLQRLPRYPGTPVTVSASYPDSARDLLTELLKIDPNTRTTASSALLHPYFRDFHSIYSNNVPHANQLSRRATESIRHRGHVQPQRRQSQANPRPPIYPQQWEQGANLSGRSTPDNVAFSDILCDSPKPISQREQTPGPRRHRSNAELSSSIHPPIHRLGPLNNHLPNNDNPPVRRTGTERPSVNPPAPVPERPSNYPPTHLPARPLRNNPPTYKSELSSNNPPTYQSVVPNHVKSIASPPFWNGEVRSSNYPLTHLLGRPSNYPPTHRPERPLHNNLPTYQPERFLNNPLIPNHAQPIVLGPPNWNVYTQNYPNAVVHQYHQNGNQQPQFISVFPPKLAYHVFPHCIRSR